MCAFRAAGRAKVGKKNAAARKIGRRRSKKRKERGRVPENLPDAEEKNVGVRGFETPRFDKKSRSQRERLKKRSSANVFN